MRSQWESLNEALSRVVHSASAKSQFRTWGEAIPLLASFETPTVLVAYLTGVDRLDRDLDTKDQIYATLIRAVQSQWPGAQLAYALAWCGLYPGLDHIFDRHQRFLRAEPDELSSKIADAFTTLVGRMDLARVHRVAAWIARGVNRALLSEQRRTRDELARRVEMPREAGADLERFVVARGVFAENHVSSSRELARLRELLVPVIGTDADLVLSVVVLGNNVREAAEQLGVSHQVARKRHQRALARLRLQLG